MNDYWCIPSKDDADFVTRMGDVPDIYELPYDPMYPVVYMYEKHHVSIHEHRTAVGCAMEIKYLFYVMFPDVKKIILIINNLNPHKTTSLYKAFPPAEARRLIKHLEIHYTPKHGSWLDIGEIELNVITRQCLSRKIVRIENLNCELYAWKEKRNHNTSKIQ